MLRVPKLGGDEEILALDALAERFPERIGDLLLVAIYLGKINVFVAGFERLVNSGLDLPGLSLPCSEPQLTVTFLVSKRDINSHPTTYGMEAPVLSFTERLRDIACDLRFER
jgi:hypothetical protein